MLISSQNVVPLPTQYRQVIAVSAQNPGFVLDPRRDVTLIKQLAMGNDRICQLNGRTIQNDHVNPVRTQPVRQVVAQPDLTLPCFCRRVQ
jgi:hypothetical protein